MARRRSALEWRGLVERFESSGLSGEVFARRNQLNPRTLLWWQSRIRCGHAKVTEEFRFVEVLPRAEVAPPALQGEPSPSRRAAVSVYARGVRVEVRPGFDPATLTAVLEALSVQVQVVVDQTRRPTPQDEWGALSAERQDILAALVAVAEDSGELDRPVQHEELVERVRSPAAVLKMPAKGLAERGHLWFNEFSGGWAVSLTPRGFVFTQLAREPDATRAAVGALARSLPAEGVSTVGKVAEAAGTGLPLALAVVRRWAELQLLEASAVHPPEHSRVLNVQQVLLEARSDEVAVDLLKLV